MEAISFHEAKAKSQSIGKIKQSLISAIDSRGRHYQNIFALSFHFAHDQTGGADDSVTFVSIARSLEVETPQVFTITDPGKESYSPEYAVGQELWELLLSCVPPTDSKARVLVLLHYAGHGKVDKNEELVFFADSACPRTFRYNFTLNPLFTPFAITLDQVDAVTILDACHVRFVTRGSTQTGRASEVVSAVRENQKALPKQNRITFTSRLASEIALRR